MQGGGEVRLRIVGGQRFIPVEGVFSDSSYRDIVSNGAAQGLTRDERRQLLASELSIAVQALRSQVRVLDLKTRPEIGYFRALIPLDSYSQLANTPAMSRTVLINPVVSARFDANAARKPSAESAAGLTAFDDARSDPTAFSGLTRIKVPEFLAQIKAELGVTPDGSQVLVGVADTGITFNHPTFAGPDGQSRVVYLKDFTDEARIFFHPDAAFSIRIPPASAGGETPQDALRLSAEFLVAPAYDEDPVADVFSTVEDLPILVSPELRAILTTPNSGARLGVLSEAAYNSFGQPVDINRNGKNDDKLWVILIPAQAEAGRAHDVLYVDVSGRGDFRQATALSDFNVARTTQAAFQERFGVDIKPATLLDSDGEAVEVVAAAVVGFDPGNHGSHVAGIIAGNKIIANSPDDTLARGVAPGARLMMDRVCANSGGCDTLESLIDLAENGAEVVNVSIGGLGPYNDGYGVEETVINRLTVVYNTLFFISAGNEGPGRNTVGSPSVARFAISVGATASRSLLERQYQWPGSGKPDGENPADDDFLLFFSSRGPTAAGGFKPDLTAPGTELSSVQLNAPAGQREGLDVYWGTSMAAPTATGAAALLIDSIKTHNAQQAGAPLPLDALTLRRVITTSARPFDVHSYNPRTQEYSQGQYTWIDQGHGMIDLVRAWAALKAERDSRLPTAITRTADGVTRPVQLDYDVRVLRTNPNGAAYDGSVLVPTSSDTKEPRYGRGVWLDARSNNSVVPVQITRRLPPDLTSAPDVAELTRALNTTADTFKLDTVIYGSKLPFIQAGTLSSLDAATYPTADLTVIGAGPIDPAIAPNSESGAPSTAPRDSTLYVHIDRTLFDALPPGDHGALIYGYRSVADKTETIPSFVVPVYVTKPQTSLAGRAGYTVKGSVRSFGVARNYVSVPSGTKLVKVTLEVPAPSVSGTTVTGCAGVQLHAYEAVNVANPIEFAARPARALGCDGTGRPNIPELHRITYARQNPTPGLWDLHVFGLYQYANSQYTLNVEYAKLSATPKQVDGGLDALRGAIDVTFEEASFPLELSAENSRYQLFAHEHTASSKVAQDEKLRVPNLAGEVARTYDPDVVEVEIRTGNSDGNDIDLVVRECDDPEGTLCTIAASSGSPTDVESATFTPVAGKYYVVVIKGFKIVDEGAFEITESLRHEQPDEGTLTGATSNPLHFEYALDPATSTLLQHAGFTSGDYSVAGAIDLVDTNGTVILTIPVSIHQ